MTDTPTDLPARVEEALRLNKRLSDALTAASVANSPEQTRATQERVRAAEEACRAPNHDLVPALAADWKRLREENAMLSRDSGDAAIQIERDYHELVRLRDLDQERIDRIAHYRTLALQLGATEEQMAEDFDRFVWKVHADEQAELERLREREQVLTEALQSAASGLDACALALTTREMLKTANAAFKQADAARAALAPEPK